MTNYGALAILAMPKMPERHLRFLIALETVTPSGTSWRHIGTSLLAAKAGLSPATIRRSCSELVRSGTIAYIPGNGRGHLSRFQILTDLKGGNESDHLSDGKGDQTGSERCSNSPRKGDPKKPVTSGNKNTGLGTSGLDTSGLPPRDTASLNGQPRGHLEDPAPVADTITRYQPRTEACKTGDHQLCMFSWCTCACGHRSRRP